MHTWPLLQMVLETKASLEGGLISAGHRFAASRLDAQRSIAGWVSESMGGVSYLEFIRCVLFYQFPSPDKRYAAHKKLLHTLYFG